MVKAEVLELKKRFKKDKNNIVRVSGCYVNGEKKKLATFKEDFLSLDESEMFKYLDLAKKSIGGTLGNNLLELEFPTEEEKQGGVQANLLALKKSELKDDTILNAFYDMIIEKYNIVDNYLILLFYDVYDVPAKGSDKRSQGESEDVYDYILCALCPVSLGKAALGYIKEEEKIGIVEGSWTVKPPETAFLFPAFNDRKSDIHATLFYTKNTMEPHTEVMEDILKCKAVSTADLIRDGFNNMIANAVQKTNNEEEVEDTILMAHKTLQDYIDAKGGGVHKDTEEHDILLLGKETLHDLANDLDFEEDAIDDLDTDFDDIFGDSEVYISKVVDSKLLKKNAIRLENISLKKQLRALKRKVDKG